MPHDHRRGKRAMKEEGEEKDRREGQRRAHRRHAARNTRELSPPHFHRTETRLSLNSEVTYLDKRH